MTEIEVSQIRTDGGTQSRSQLHEGVIEEYAEAMQTGSIFPAIVVFFDGQDYWLADGFHRLSAAKKIGASNIQADIHLGQQRDAVLYAVGVNATHGLRRTNADKRRAVEILLQDPEWTQWSDREIARRCAVSDRFVNSIRKQTASPHTAEPHCHQRKVYRNGKIYMLNTSNIGRSTAKSSSSSPSKKYRSRPNQSSTRAKGAIAKRSVCLGSKTTSKVRIRCLDLQPHLSSETAETFAIQSQSLKAEIVCAPSMMVELLEHVRDYPAFVETLLKQAQFCKQQV